MRKIKKMLGRWQKALPEIEKDKRIGEETKIEEPKVEESKKELTFKEEIAKNEDAVKAVLDIAYSKIGGRETSINSQKFRWQKIS